MDMDSDFHFKAPQSSEPENKSSDESTNDVTSTEQSPDMVPASESQDQLAPASQVVTSARPKKGHGLLVFFVMLLLLAAACGGYYWQHKAKNDWMNKSVAEQAQLDTLKSQLKAAKASNNQVPASGSLAVPTSNYTIVTGAPTKIADTEVDVIAQYGLNPMPTEVWVESGTAPDKLTTASNHSKTSSEGPAGETYSSEGVALSGLKAGGHYYYRAAGLVDGKTVYGGVVSVDTTKAK